MAEGPVTELLRRVSEGDKEAEQDLIKRVFPDLHGMAERRFRRESPGHVLQPTALVNEVYLKMMVDEPGWKNRAHFFAVASRVMRQVLTDHARKSRAEKRGGATTPVALNNRIALDQQQCADLLDLQDALEALEQIDERKATVVINRYFGDMTEDEIAETLGIATRTVKRDWEFARAWLKEYLSRRSRRPDPGKI